MVSLKSQDIGVHIHEMSLRSKPISRTDFSPGALVGRDWWMLETSTIVNVLTAA